ncbi:carbonic anhydrase [Aspergillus tanneri]|uniref:Carbonic anhydrase n=1 Tax=Aspergillus tanneri TaxID=1220188 RepID=A0A5M9MQB5_9EURO|nr:uncharacterized protein ATNIH1004_005203 [Aspergillus tanneri]KAA8649302.1 hypothetical protein ATNIH1004_005203 [Aspergillus tanneri]
MESKQSVRRFLEQSHERIFENNRQWVASKQQNDPEFFTKLAAGQTPEYLYIGCSDSRVPANEIMGLEAGEVFVHRNIANLVPNTDLNVMSVINYAVRHLQVKHIIVCGHYRCGGVQAALTPSDLGILNPGSETSVMNIVKTAAVQQSYQEKQYPIVHGWVFDLRDGLLKDLHVNFEEMLHDIKKIYNLPSKATPPTGAN